MKIFGVHRVRNTFYFGTLVLYLLLMVAAYRGLITDSACSIAGAVLVFLDLVAHLYDPNPDNPGSWFKAHFHRLYDEDEEDV